MSKWRRTKRPDEEWTFEIPTRFGLILGIFFFGILPFYFGLDYYLSHYTKVVRVTKEVSVQSGDLLPGVRGNIVFEEAVDDHTFAFVKEMDIGRQREEKILVEGKPLPFLMNNEEVLRFKRYKNGTMFLSHSYEERVSRLK